jgi:hypothetical protein
MDMMMRKTVYLCGGINGLTDDECVSWRNQVKDKLKGLVNFLDPMRRDYRGIEDKYPGEIVEGDKTDIKNSDVILVLANVPSWGTAMEVFFASSLGKRIVCVCGKDNPSPWLKYHSDYITRDMECAVAIIKSIVGLDFLVRS